MSRFWASISPIRGDERVECADADLREGDILLVTGADSDLNAMARAENLLMLEGAKEMPRTAKAPLALAIMASSVLPASLGLVPIAISALGRRDRHVRHRLRQVRPGRPGAVRAMSSC